MVMYMGPPRLRDHIIATKYIYQRGKFSVNCYNKIIILFLNKKIKILVVVASWFFSVIYWLLKIIQESISFFSHNKNICLLSRSIKSKKPMTIKSIYKL